LSKFSARQFCNQVGAELFIYVETFCDKNFKENWHIFENSTILLQELLYCINLHLQLWPTLWPILLYNINCYSLWSCKVSDKGDGTLESSQGPISRGLT